MLDLVSPEHGGRAGGDHGVPEAHHHVVTAGGQHSHLWSRCRLVRMFYPLLDVHKFLT